MKVARFKKLAKTLMFFSLNYEYREPYLVLIDGTFCHAALQHKVIIEEQLKKYFQSAIKLVTTQCIILEAESLGGPLVGATKIVKQFQVHKCGHEGKPVKAVDCIKSMTKTARYIVASQDRILQESLRNVPGRCLLYLHKATPVLEAPSPASKKWVAKKCTELIMPKISSTLKKETSVAAASTEIKTYRKRTKNPNPLSCKKSKKQTKLPQTTNKEQKVSTNSRVTMKAKRKRTKIRAHIKEIVNEKK